MSKNSEQVTNARLVLNTNKAVVSERQQPLPDPFKLYNDKAAHEDKAFITDCNESIDTMLVFAGLFSAVITTFVVQTSALLQADPQDRVTQLLTVLINTTAGSQLPIPPAEPFSPSGIIITINALFFISLILSLGAALGAMLVKQWARQYQLRAINSGLSWETAGDRHNRHLGLLRWHLDDLIAWVPMLLHIALTIFLLGVVLWLHTLHRALFIAATGLFTLGATIYGIFAIIPVFATNAPFQWPISNLLQAIINTARQFGRSTIARLHRAETNNTENFDLEIGGPVAPQYLLTPRLEDALLPILPEKPRRQSIDALVLIELLQKTAVKEEIEAVMEQLRLGDWSGVNIGGILFKNGELILQRCSEVSASTWWTEYSVHIIRDGMFERARRTCRFIEWFYYQLSVSERKSLTKWPKMEIAWALRNHAKLMLEEDLPQPPKSLNTLSISTMLEDMVLAESVIAKLKHVSLASDERCTLSFIPGRRDQKNIRFVVKRIEHPRSSAEKLFSLESFKEALVSSCVVSDADCLLNYMRVADSGECKALIDTSAREYLLSLASLRAAFAKRYQLLVPVLQGLQGRLEESDTRVTWFTELIKSTHRKIPKDIWTPPKIAPVTG